MLEITGPYQNSTAMPFQLNKISPKLLYAYYSQQLYYQYDSDYSR